MSNQKTIIFEVVTPERVILKDEVTQVTVPTREGEITVLPNHIPLIATLSHGVIETKTKSGEIKIMSVSGGFIEVLKDKVVILADKAERAEEIDIARAEEARKRAEDLKTQAVHKYDVNFADINAQIAKEMARTHAAKKWRKIKELDH